MAANIRLKKSAVAGRQPGVSDLDYGELAINYADGILYYKSNNNVVSSISGGGAETDSAAPTGSSLRTGDLWWDATNGRLKIYYDDGDPAADTPITVSMTVNGSLTNNSQYVFNTGWTDRSGTNSLSSGNPTIQLQQGDTLTITNGEFSNHPLFFVTDTAQDGSYDAQYNVELPTTNYGGGTVTVSYQFNSPGTYYYICGTHKAMIGEIVVTSSATASKQWVDASPQGRGYTGSAGAIGYSENAPSSPAAGQIWYDTKTGKSYFYYVVSGNGAWVLFSDPTIADGNQGYVGSQGYTGSRGTVSPRGIYITTPQTNGEHTLLYTDTALTVSEIRGVRRGGTSVEFSLKTASDRSATGTTIGSGTITSTTTGDTITVSSSSIAAGSYVWVELIDVTGVVNECHINVIFSE